MHRYVRFVSEAAALDGERSRSAASCTPAGATMPLTIEATLRRVGDKLEVDAVTEADHYQLDLEVPRVLEVDDLALVIGVWSFNRTGPDGEPVRLAARRRTSCGVRRTAPGAS